MEKAVKQCTSDVDISFLREHLCSVFGNLRSIISDDGPGFKATAFEEKLQQFGIKWKPVSP